MILVAGIYFPIPAAVLGLAIFIGRIIYSVGYVIGGPKGRSIGALINDFAMLGAFVLSVISSVYFIIGKDVWFLYPILFNFTIHFSSENIKFNWIFAIFTYKTLFI